MSWSTARASARAEPSNRPSEALWEQTLAINLKGPWLGIKAALPLLARSGEGRSSTSDRRARRGRCRDSSPIS